MTQAVDPTNKEYFFEYYIQPYGWRPSNGTKYRWYAIEKTVNANEVVNLSDEVKLYYTLTPIPAAAKPVNPFKYSSSYHNYRTHNVDVYVSIDGGKTYVPGINEYTFESKHPNHFQKFEVVAAELKKSYVNKMTRLKAKETLEKNRVEAEKLGIPLEELLSKRTAERNKKIENSRTKRSVEETQQLIELSKILAKMSAYIESIKQKMNNDDSDLNLGHFSRKMKNLDESVSWLQNINTSKDKKRKR